MKSQSAKLSPRVSGLRLHWGIRLLGLAFVSLSVPYTAMAQSACTDGDIYLSQGQPLTTLLHSQGIVGNDINFSIKNVEVGQYNALGRSPTDGKLYAIRNGTGELLTVDPANGQATNVCIVAGLELPNVDSRNYYIGGFDTAGVFYVKKQGLGNTIYSINVATLTATPISLSQIIIISDMAWVGDRLYTTDDNGQLYSITVPDGTTTAIGVPDTTGGTFGAQFSGTNGLFGVSNSGAGFFQIDLATGARTKVADAPTSIINDGASCPNVELLQIPPKSADLQITKDDGLTRYTPGSNVVYTIKATNIGPDAVVGATVRDALPTGITTASWTCSADMGAVCTASGSGAVQDAAVNLPVGASVTYVLTMAIPVSFTGNLVNTATVTVPNGVTDPTPSNNTATDTDTPTLPPAAAVPVPTVSEWALALMTLMMTGVAALRLRKHAGSQR